MAQGLFLNVPLVVSLSGGATVGRALGLPVRGVTVPHCRWTGQVRQVVRGRFVRASCQKPGKIRHNLSGDPSTVDARIQASLD
jgi:hypothetical protein